MLFKKKNTQKKDNCKIVFKQKDNLRNSNKRKPSKKSFVVSAKTMTPLGRKQNSRVEKMKKIKRRNFFLNIIFLSIVLSIVIFVGYTTVNFITSIRGGTSSEDLVYHNTYVEGIPLVPVYPKSEFVYEDRKGEEVVLKMLNQGISVYRLPRNTKSSDIYEYYEEVLPKNDWEFLFTIVTSTENQLFGQYWQKEEKGLRIYVEGNDLWYETITKTEANSALAERRSQEIQRKRILETSSEQTLLPDYPWALSIPREYLTRYSSTDIGELQAVEIFEIGGTTKFLIYPIGKSGEGSYDNLLDKFLKKQTEELEEKWEVINTIVDFKKDREVLNARVLIDNEEGQGIVLMNINTHIIYAIIANKRDHPFFEQIVREIQEP